MTDETAAALANVASVLDAAFGGEAVPDDRVPFEAIHKIIVANYSDIVDAYIIGRGLTGKYRLEVSGTLIREP